MKLENFKSHTIKRSHLPAKKNYRAYFEDLKKDFGGRCAYCNLHFQSITTPFEIDHFIPQKEIKDRRPELMAEYSNLIFACKKCNIAKGSQFSGDLSLEKPTNELFYDPAAVDYNTIFYRNELGLIDSDDPKGRTMIGSLKLYRPIHILGWLCEKLNFLADRLEKKIDAETNSEVRETYEEALNKINQQYRKFIRLFISSYNDDRFDLRKDT